MQCRGAFECSFDQSAQGNHLAQRISDGVVHKMVNASKHKISVAGGVEVFGMWFDPGHGYHVDYTSGVAKGNEPESIYAVMSGTHFNGHCIPSAPRTRVAFPPALDSPAFGPPRWQAASTTGTARTRP